MNTKATHTVAFFICGWNRPKIGRAAASLWHLAPEGEPGFGLRLSNPQGQQQP